MAPTDTNLQLPKLTITLHDEHGLKADGSSTKFLHDIDTALATSSEGPPSASLTKRTSRGAQMAALMDRMAQLETAVAGLNPQSPTSRSSAAAGDQSLSPLRARAGSTASFGSIPQSAVQTPLGELVIQVPETPSRENSQSPVLQTDARGRDSDLTSLSSFGRDASPGAQYEHELLEDRVARRRKHRDTERRVAQTAAKVALYTVAGFSDAASSARSNQAMWAHNGDFAPMAASVARMKSSANRALGTAVTGAALMVGSHVAQYMKDGLPEKLIPAAELNIAAAYTGGLVLAGTGIYAAFTLKKAGQDSVEYLGKVAEKNAISPLAYHAIKNEKNDLAGMAVIHELLKRGMHNTFEGDIPSPTEPIDLSWIEAKAELKIAGEKNPDNYLEKTKKIAHERIGKHIKAFAEKHPEHKMKITHETEFHFDILRARTQGQVAEMV